MFRNFEWVFVQVNLMLRPGFLIHGSFRFIYQRKQDLRRKQNNWQCIKRIEARKGILLKNIWQLPEKYKIFKPILEQIPEPKVAYALSLPKLLKEVDKIIIPALSTSDLNYFINMYNFDTCNIDYAQFRTK